MARPAARRTAALGAARPRRRPARGSPPTSPPAGGRWRRRDRRDPAGRPHPAGPRRPRGRRHCHGLGPARHAHRRGAGPLRHVVRRGGLPRARDPVGHRAGAARPRATRSTSSLAARSTTPAAHHRWADPARAGTPRGRPSTSSATWASRVEVRPSPWRLERHDGSLISEWLDGWVGAAVEQRPSLATAGRATTSRDAPTDLEHGRAHRHRGARRPAGRPTPVAAVSRLADPVTTEGSLLPPREAGPATSARCAGGRARRPGSPARRAVVDRGPRAGRLGRGDRVRRRDRHARAAPELAAPAQPAGAGRPRHALAGTDGLRCRRPDRRGAAGLPLRPPPWWPSACRPWRSTPSTVGWPGAPARSASSGHASTARSTRSSSSCSASPPAHGRLGVLAAGLVRYAFAVAGWVPAVDARPLEFRYWRKVVTAAVGIAAHRRASPTCCPPAADHARRARRARPARRVVRPRRVVAVAPPGTRDARACAAPVVAAATAAAAAASWPRRLRDRCSRWRWCGSRSSRRPGRTGSPPAPSCGCRWRPWPSPSSPWSLSKRWGRAVTVVRRHRPGGRHPAQGARHRGLHGARPAVQRGDRPQRARLRLRLPALLARAVGRVGQRGRRPSSRSAPPWPACRWAVGRLSGVVSRHRARSTRAVVAVAVVWGVCALTGLQVSAGGPIAAADTAPFVADKVRAATAAYRDEAGLRARAGGGPPPRPGLRRPVGPGRQGRRARLRRELRSGRRRRARVGRHPHPAGQRHRTAAAAWAGRHPVAGSPPRPSVAAAGSPTPRSSPGSPWVTRCATTGCCRARGRRSARPSRRAGWRTVAVLPVDPRTLARGQGASTASTGSTTGRPRLRRAGVRLLGDARPVHPRRVRPAGARPRRRTARHGRGRAHLEPRAVGAAADHGRPGRCSATGRSSTAHPGGCRDGGRSCGATGPTCPARTAPRSPTRSPACWRSWRGTPPTTSSS